MNSEELKKINDNLTKNDRKKLAEDFDVTVGHIYNVLNGKKENIDIVIAAKEIVRKRKEIKEEFSAFVSSL